MEHTTLKPQQLGTLLDELSNLRARNKALGKKLQFLEERLEQRFEETRKDFQKLLPHLMQMQNKIMEIFLEIEPCRGLSHEEIQERFAHKFPMLSATNTPRRVRELVEQKMLWRKDDPDGTARFYLYLELREIEKVGQDGDDRKNTANLKSLERDRGV